jgi:predicted HTH transcriptional regulator
VARPIAALLAEREGTRLDFKRDLSSMRRVIETVCSFLNTAGGTLVVGVEDGTRALRGVPDVEREEERLANAVASSIEPQPSARLEIVTYDGHDLLLLDVPYVAGPFYLKAAGKDRGTYIRLGSNSIPASPEKIAELERVRAGVGWDQEPVAGLSADDLDADRIARWFDSVGDPPPTPARQRGLGMLAPIGDDLVPTRAGVILFGRDREAHFPAAEIRCVRFRSLDKSEPAASHEMDGTVLDGIDQALAFVERNTDSVPLISGRAQRAEVEPYEPVALREIVNNCVSHADYSIEGASIFVALYPDRLEVSSPGTWPPGFSVEDFKSGVSLRRNRAIARILRRLHVSEGYGSGYDRVVAACRSGGYPIPEWVENGPQIKVILRPHPSVEGGEPREAEAPEATRQTPEERRTAILDAIDQSDRPNATALQERTGIPGRTLVRELGVLRDQGLVEFVGPRRSGHYRRVTHPAST